IAARQLILVTRAFGEAFHRHWYGDERNGAGSGGWERLKQDPLSPARRAQLELRLRVAAERLQQVRGRPAAENRDRITALMGDPLRSLYAQQLWDALVDPSLVKPGETPLVMPDAYHQFRRHFRLAYAEGLASAPGQEIRRHLISISDDRPSIV